ncbi:MAG TPA: hypothetical protein VFU82_04815 [Gammaproteobacteria bacterium]|nr:hypothetical protein [Gammaproteobacteria bacterium]
MAEVDIIAKLRTFVNPLSGETGAELKAVGTQADSLSKEALYELALMLLTRKKSTRAHKAGKPTQSELVAEALEARFETSRMACFRLCSRVTELNQAIFDLIWDVDSLEVLPQTITDVKAWLIAKSLLAAPPQNLSESAMIDLEQSGKLAPYLSNQDLSALSRVSHDFHRLFKLALEARLAQQLGQLIIHADLDGAKKMIQAHPGLLTIPMTVTDYSNRKIQGTALQLALGAEDVRYHDHEIAMVEMIMGELEKQPDGERMIAQQIAQQFPAGWEADHEARVARDQAALNAFVTAIANSNNQADWEAAAEIYRERIDNENLGKGVIKTGLHCNAQLVAAWFHAYNQNYAAFGNDWNSRKNVFLWQKGSYCRRYLTTPFRRALVGRPSASPTAGGEDARAWAASFSSYVRQKTSTLRRLTQECNSNLETKPHHLK